MSLRTLFEKKNYSKKVILTVFDNCLCKFPTSFEGIRGQGDGSESYLFIKWFAVPILEADVPVELDADSEF